MKRIFKRAVEKVDELEKELDYRMAGMAGEMRGCAKCGKIKSVLKFSMKPKGRGKKQPIETVCKECKAIVAREWNKKNRTYWSIKSLPSRKKQAEARRMMREEE